MMVQIFLGFSHKKTDLLFKTTKKFLQFFFHKTVVIGASRTDSGVHAYHQEISSTNKDFSQEKWLASLNVMLPRTIGILDIKIAKSGFHPIPCKQKIYRYSLWNKRCFNPLSMFVSL